MSVIGLFVHRDRKEAAALARQAAEFLIDRGHEVRLPAEDAAALGLDPCACDADGIAAGLDVAISLGGDGTMLRTVDVVSGAGVPVLGVNFGRLGYLTEVEPTQLQTALERVVADDFSVEERMVLSIDVDAPSRSIEPATLFALNEAVVEKPASGHTIHLAVAIDGQPFTTYAADGLIVATPTGSTAYSFSARGPILSPRHRALLLTPVSPHMLFDRSLVLDPRESLRIEVLDERPALLTVDGRDIGLLERGDAIVTTAAAHPARLVTFGPRDFYRILKAKFGLADR